MTCTVRGISVDGRRGTLDKRGHREYTVVYKVVSDDRRDGPVQAGNAPGVPQIGDLYAPGNDVDNAAITIAVEVNQGDSPYEWLIDVTYSTDLGSYEPHKFENPLDEPPELSFGFQERRTICTGRWTDPTSPDPNGALQQGFAASNLEPFDPQPEVPVCDPVWTIKKNIQDISYLAFMSLANCVNSDIFQGCSPRTLQLKPPTATRKWHKNVQFYWDVSYQIIFRWETWDLQLLNQGTYYWVNGVPTSNPLSSSNQNNRRPATDSFGNPIVVNLTSSGALNNTSIPTFQRIRYFREINFSALNLL